MRECGLQCVALLCPWASAALLHSPPPPPPDDRNPVAFHGRRLRHLRQSPSGVLAAGRRVRDSAFALCSAQQGTPASSAQIVRFHCPSVNNRQVVMEHQSCAHCEASLSGQRYVLRDEKPCCLACFDQKYANQCESCEKPIGTDFRDLSYKGRHWHEHCFKCWGCKNSLAGQQFVPRDDGLFCGDCFDNNFAQRCDVCTKTFKNGMKKYDYNSKKYHEECFLCSLCKKEIGNNSFVPRENDELACMGCFEEKLAQRCAVCSQVLIKGGVMFQNLSYHKECFVCKGCNAELANMKFATKDDAQYCPDCYVKNFAKSCERCTKPIAGLGQATKYIAFEGRQWHAECFLCNRCDKVLVGQGFVVLTGEVMCPECGNK